MANSDYTYYQVLSGIGSYSEAGDTGVSSGVKEVQTQLSKIGYTVTANGRFQSTTTSAVKAFQAGCGITQNGVVNKDVLVRLKAAYSSEYYEYGAPLTNSEWGVSNILTGKFNDIDLLARIIYAENTAIIDDQNGIALVIKNRSVTPGYFASASTYPQASIWARVIGAKNGYTTADSGNVHAQVPKRGYQGDAPDYIASGWKNAVDCAKKLVNGEVIHTTGFIVSGKTITSRRLNVYSDKNPNYLNQSSWSQYLTWLSDGIIDSSVQPLTFTSTGSNVICRGDWTQS